MTTKIITAAQGEPIDLAEAKNHLRVTSSDEDTLIRGLISVARVRGESTMGQAFVVRTAELPLDYFPGDESVIELPLAPLISVTSIKYIDTDGALQTWDAANYTVDPDSNPGRIFLSYDKTWPSDTRDIQNAVTIRFVCGYVTPFSVVAATNIATPKGRILANGDIVRLLNSGGVLPAGLAIDTDYYVVEVSGSTFKLSATLAGAAIDITDTGTGTHFVGTGPHFLDKWPAIRAAMLIDLADLYEHREDIVEGNSIAQLGVVDALYWSAGRLVKI